MGIPFTPPTRDYKAWSDGDHPLWRHYGGIPAGITIYKVDGVWHNAPDGYDPIILDDAELFYLGGREYDLTYEEYLELLIAGFIPDALTSYPSDSTYPGILMFPGGV